LISIPFAVPTPSAANLSFVVVRDPVLIRLVPRDLAEMNFELWLQRIERTEIQVPVNPVHFRNWGSNEILISNLTELLRRNLC
jgi:hypothetical protein